MSITLAPITAADVPDADAVIATFWESAFVVIGLPPSKGRKFYFVQHHEIHLAQQRHFAAGSYFLPLRKITIAGWLADAMRDIYGDPDVTVVPNSVDHSLFHAPSRSRQTVPTVGLMYSTKRFKGSTRPSRRSASPARGIPRLKVVAFGKSDPVRTLPLPEGSLYIRNPRQSQLREIYAMCDVFAAGSRSEGFGLPILEAMACRCPVVATRTGCAPDVIEDGVNGFVVDVGDASAMGGRLADVLDLDAASWQAMSDAALERVLPYTGTRRHGCSSRHCSRAEPNTSVPHRSCGTRAGPAIVHRPRSREARLAAMWTR